MGTRPANIVLKHFVELISLSFGLWHSVQFSAMVTRKDTNAAFAKEAGVENFEPSTRAIHADDVLNSSTDVAPAMHVSTTFRYSENPDELHPADDGEVGPVTLLISYASRFQFQYPRHD